MRFLGDLLQGDLGVSLTSGQDVVGLLEKAIPVTIQLTLLAMLLAVVYALVFGILSAVYRGTWFDKLGRALSIGASPRRRSGSVSCWCRSSRWSWGCCLRAATCR